MKDDKYIPSPRARCITVCMMFALWLAFQICLWLDLVHPLWYVALFILAPIWAICWLIVSHIIQALFGIFGGGRR